MVQTKHTLILLNLSIVWCCAVALWPFFYLHFHLFISQLSMCLACTNLPMRSCWFHRLVHPDACEVRLTAKRVICSIGRERRPTAEGSEGMDPSTVVSSVWFVWIWWNLWKLCFLAHILICVASCLKINQFWFFHLGRTEYEENDENMAKHRLRFVMGFLQKCICSCIRGKLNVLWKM